MNESQKRKIKEMVQTCFTLAQAGERVKWTYKAEFLNRNVEKMTNTFISLFEEYAKEVNQDGSKTKS